MMTLRGSVSLLSSRSFLWPKNITKTGKNIFTATSNLQILRVQIYLDMASSSIYGQTEINCLPVRSYCILRDLLHAWTLSPTKVFLTDSTGVWMSLQHEPLSVAVYHGSWDVTASEADSSCSFLGETKKGGELTKSGIEFSSLTSLCFCGSTAVVFWRTIFAACVAEVVVWSHLTHISLKLVCFLYL